MDTNTERNGYTLCQYTRFLAKEFASTTFYKRKSKTEIIKKNNFEEVSTIRLQVILLVNSAET